MAAVSGSPVVYREERRAAMSGMGCGDGYAFGRDSDQGIGRGRAGKEKIVPDVNELLAKKAKVASR